MEGITRDRGAKLNKHRKREYMKENDFRLFIFSVPQGEDSYVNRACLYFDTTIISYIFGFTEYSEREEDGMTFYDFYDGTKLLGCVQVFPDMLVAEEVR